MCNAVLVDTLLKSKNLRTTRSVYVQAAFFFPANSRTRDVFYRTVRATSYTNSCSADALYYSGCRSLLSELFFLLDNLESRPTDC